MIDRAELSLDELCREVSAELGRRSLREAQDDGRVSGEPDMRTVRYYTTFGLVDRPSRAQREARYGRRHVLQLVAIKALQAAGLPLSEIQARVYARSNPELENLLQSLQEARACRPVAVRSVTWREVALEPGIKLMVEEGWSPRMSPAALEERVRAALTALAAEGGSKP